MTTRKIIVMSLLLCLMVFMKVSFASTTEIIDESDLSKGLVHITYKSSENTAFRVLIAKDDERITYPFFANGKKESFPLQLGNGTYQVGLLKSVGDNRFVFVTQKRIKIDLKDDKVVFLNSIQNVSWQPNYEAIKYGEQLLKGRTTTTLKTRALYEFLVKEVRYDYDKIPNLTSEYVPSIPVVFDVRKGICYDYSALLAGINRSQGIPTRLVKGYAKGVDGYHAWNEVFLNGKWRVIDSTVDSASGPKSTMFKSDKDYVRVNFY